MSEQTLKNLELCTAGYAAIQFLGLNGVHVYAMGMHATSGYQAFFEPDCKADPPEFTLWHIAPTGPVLGVLTPFIVSIGCGTREKIEAVIVRDARGEHEIPVQHVPWCKGEIIIPAEWINEPEEEG